MRNESGSRGRDETHLLRLTLRLVAASTHTTNHNPDCQLFPLKQAAPSNSHSTAADLPKEVADAFRESMQSGDVLL